MIQKIGKITLYVNNQEEAKNFWVNQCDFVVQAELNMGDSSWLEVAPKTDTQTTLVLYDKKLMKAQKPNQNVGCPSILFSTNQIEQAYTSMKEKGVFVGELMKMPYGSMFTFHDQDGNEFLLRED